MTESDWLFSVNPAAMLQRLDHHRIRGASPACDAASNDRKLRLFACACCRQPEVWDRLTDDAPCPGMVPEQWAGCSGPLCLVCGGTGRVNRSRRAVEVAERYADGLATLYDLTPWAGAAEALQFYRWEELISDDPSDKRTHADPLWSALCWVGVATSRHLLDGGLNGTGLMGNERVFATTVPAATQTALLRCIFGNPFRPVVLPKQVIAGRYETCPWITCTVARLAQRIYDERDWSAMSVLADALEDAGCTDEDILMHCRGWHKCLCSVALRAGCKGPWVDGLGRPCPCGGTGRVPAPLHARGCWVLDLILGRV